MANLEQHIQQAHAMRRSYCTAKCNPNGLVALVHMTLLQIVESMQAFRRPRIVFWTGEETANMFMFCCHA